jgi:tetratricopeptide (TPR) repeat protein
VCIGDTERDRFLATLGDNCYAVQDALRQIDSARAEAGDPADRARINAAIEAEIEHGHVGLNTIVFEQIRPALLAIAQEAAAVARARCRAGGLGTSMARDAADVAAQQLHLQGDNTAAAHLYEELIEAAAVADPDPHSKETLHYKSGFAMVLAKQGKYAAAAVQFEAVIDGDTAVHGADSDHTLIDKGNYSNTLDDLGRHAKAAALSREVLAAREARGERGTEKALRETARLADQLKNLKRLDEAGRLFREVIAGHTALLGARHEDTLMAQGNYANLLSKQKRFEEAIELLRELVATMAMTFGEDHVHTLAAKENLANTLADSQNKWVKVLPSGFWDL